MAIFKPIKQVRVSEEISEQLKESILQGHFKAGDKLPAERELADEFGVSRTAVRQALSALANTGFVVVRQGSGGGAFVTDLTFDHLVDTYLDLFLADKISIPELFQVRLLVEPEVAREAASKMSPHFAKHLRAALKAERTTSSTLAEDIEKQWAVHLILAEMCGNRFFESLVRSAMSLTRRIVEVLAPKLYEMHPSGLHDNIVKAVLKKDGDAAFAAMRKHSVEFGEVLVKAEKAFRLKHAKSA